MTDLRPDAALYQVCGTALPHSPLLLLTDDLSFYDVAAPEADDEDAASWFVIRLMVSPDAADELSSSLLGWGRSPADAFLSAGLQLGWMGQQNGTPSSPLVEAMLLSHAALPPLETSAEEAAIHQLLGRIEDLVLAVLSMGVEPVALLEGLSTLLGQTSRVDAALTHPEPPPSPDDAGEE